eukprot:scaffold1.g5213.t1
MPGILDRLKRASGWGGTEEGAEDKGPRSPRTNVWQEVFDPNTNPALKKAGRSYYDHPEPGEKPKSVMDYQVESEKARQDVKQAAFATLSANKDTIDASDLRKLFDQARVERIMEFADKNKDGKIDYQEGATAAQQEAWNKTYNATNAHFHLEEQFHRVKVAVEGHLGLLQRQAQVRVKNWLKKLSEETTNAVWKKNRNAYAQLLLEQLRAGKLAEPFHLLPPDGPLSTLPKHAVYPFRPARPSSPGPPSRPSQLAAQLRQCAKSASEALDAYVAANGGGGSDAAQARLQRRHVQFQKRQQVAEGGGGVGAVDEGGCEDDDEIAAAWPEGYLPGTRMPLRGSEMHRVDRHQLGDIAWQPSKLELEAELGASRERQRELEWRVQQAEAALRAQTQLLGGAWPGAAGPLGLGATPLGGLISDGRASPPRPRAGKQEIDELIAKYEERKRQWRSPAWARAGAGARGSPARGGSPMPAGQEEEMLGQLDAFQRQTEAIRRQLGRRGDGDSLGGGGGSGLGSPLPLPTAGRGDGGVGGAGLSQLLSELLDLPEGTPLHQLPTGLHGGGQAPRQRLDSLFDGLPPSPLAGAFAPPYSRRVEHAGHHLEQDQRAAQQQQQAEAVVQQQQEAARAPATTRGAQGVEGRQPRRPIGPEIRQTLKSEAAAHKARSSAQMQASSAASTALLRLKHRQAQATQSGAASTAGPDSPQAATPASRPPQQQQQQDAWPAPVPDGWERAGEEPTPQPAAAAGAAGAKRSAVRLGPRLTPRLDPDSNTALAAGVRELKERLLGTLQAHGDEGRVSGWSRSPAVAAVGPGATRFRLSDTSDGELRAAPCGDGSAHAAGGGALLHADDSSPFRLDDGRLRATDSSLGLSASDVAGGLPGGGGAFDLGDFQRETEALRQQVESAYRLL